MKASFTNVALDNGSFSTISKIDAKMIATRYDSYYSKVNTRIYNDYKKADQSKLLPEQWCMKLPQGATSFED